MPIPTPGHAVSCRRAARTRAYAITLQLSAIAALMLVIAAFRAPTTSPDTETMALDPQQLIEIEPVPVTEHLKTPPPPPRPPAPIEVPNNTELLDDPLAIDQIIDGPLPLDPTGPPPVEPKEPEEDEERAPFITVEQMPELIGGLASIQSKITYPEIAKKVGVEGRVFVQFVVEKDGSVSNAVVLRGIGAGCDEEALRAVREAMFTPGKQRERPVRVKMSLPITFKLR